MNVIPIPAANAAAASLFSANRADSIFDAGRALLPFLERGHAIGAADLRTILMNAFGGSDAEGFWSWKDAYEATEVAQVLFLRKFGGAINSRTNAPPQHWPCWPRSQD